MTLFLNHFLVLQTAGNYPPPPPKTVLVSLKSYLRDSGFPTYFFLIPGFFQPGISIKAGNSESHLPICYYGTEHTFLSNYQKKKQTN